MMVAWALCAYEWIDKNYRYTESYDKGKSWYRRKGGRKHPTDFDETTSLRDAGTLPEVSRCAGKNDLNRWGKTWNTALTAIPNPGSRFFIKRLRSGRILLVNNWHNKEKICLALRWKIIKRCSYPDAVQVKKIILHVRITEEDIIKGRRKL
ncbi:MAG: hypothetical protein V8T87_03720 [Victivallales bacterium]